MSETSGAAAGLVMATGPTHRSPCNGGPSAATPAWARRVGGKPAIEHVIRRLLRCKTVSRVAIVGYRDHVEGIDRAVGEGVELLAVDLEPRPDAEARIRLARGWSPSSWRGGIGGASCYDEWLDPAAMAEAMRRLNVDAAVAVAADWPLVDPGLCDRLVERHRSLPEKHRLVFTQAAPGLCGVLLERQTAAEMAAHQTTIGRALDYNPTTPKADPIGRDACVQVDAALRAPGIRASVDAPRWGSLVEAVFEAGADDDASAAVRCMSTRLRDVGHALPQQICVELTPRREAFGPAAPAHAIDLDRQDMSVSTLRALSGSIAASLRDDPGPTDMALTVGGLGDPLCHPAFDEVVDPALAPRDGGPAFACIAFETDLLAEPEAIDRLLAINVPMVIKARLNAATSETYRRVMGVDGLQRAMDNLARLAKAARPPAAPITLVPTMVKLRQNVHELEPFVDHWQGTLGTALVVGPSDGGGLVEDHAVIDMAPPRRFACRQLAHRMTVLSDGTVPRCDEDWLGREAVGNVNDQPIGDLWSPLQAVRREHERGVYPGLCERCRQWHRP